MDTAHAAFPSLRTEISGMNYESNTRRGQLKGYMWEGVVSCFLKENGFIEIANVDNGRTRRNREHFFEMRGRGTWHQIDCPCDYKHFSPFVNPLRLLAEVKFYSKSIEKHLIREFVGTIKDIQENCFVPDDFTQASMRYTELGAYFSANGFNEEAERLAFAHNIKTVSYRNIPILDDLKRIIETLERNYLSVKKCISVGNQNDFISLFREILLKKERYSEFISAKSVFDFIERFTPVDVDKEAFFNELYLLKEYFNKIKVNFIASSSAGALLHFVGSNSFPDELFKRTDEQRCRVFYRTIRTESQYYLIFSDDNSERRYYFSPPLALNRSVFFGGRKVYNEKERIFRELHISRHIDGLARTLVLKLDQDWLEKVRRDNHDE